MENSKRFRHLDRLSELPDSLIFDIYWLLPMTDVVRTSLLSRRWRSLWTTTPNLNFDNRFMLFDHNRLWKFVNRALLRMNGNRVLKFRFFSHHNLVNSMPSDVDSWLNFAKRNGVEELHLHVLPVYTVPQCLYSCSSLKELKLEYCDLKKSENVQWNQLKSLTINNSFASVDVINQILLSSPKLRVFILRYADKGGNLSIHTSSLKKVSIIKYGPCQYRSELRIWASNLETLEIMGFPYSKFLLTNVSSLRRATLGFWGSGECNFDGRFFFEALRQILPTIQHVGNVALLYCCTKVLRAMRIKFTNSSFPNVKSLDVKCCIYDYKQVVGVLEMFPQLERLVLSEQKGDGHHDDQELLEFEAILPKSFLLQLRMLRTVDVAWAKGNGVFPFIEILLKYASKLEKIVFRLIEIMSPAPSPPSDSLFLISQKLLRMRRSSTNCTIDLTKLPFQPYIGHVIPGN